MNNKTNILVAEDSPIQALMLKRMLLSHEYNVTVANNGEEALSVMNQFTPHIIISDIMMPKMNGYQFCYEVKRNDAYKSIPIIMLTELNDTKDVFKAIKAGADNYVTKPFNENFLLERIVSLLNNPVPDAQHEEEKEIEVFFDGESHVMKSTPLQILNLLISTYESAVHQNRELIKTQLDLKKLNEQLEERVLESTKDLQRSQKRLQAIMDHTTAIIYLKDSKGHYLMVNRRFESLFETRNEDIISKTDYDIFPGEAASFFYINDKKALEARAPIEMEEIIPQKDGLHTYIAIKFPLFDEKNQIMGVCGISTDITARKEAENELKKHRDMLEALVRERTSELEDTNEQLRREIEERKKAEAGQAKLIVDLERANLELNNLLYILSHDLKTPVRSIGSLADWIVEDSKERLSEESLENMKLLTDRVRKMYTLYDDISEYSKIGQLSEIRKEVDMNALVRELIEEKFKDFTINITIEKELPVIECEREQLKKVFKNLIENALKSIDKSEVQIAINCIDQKSHWQFTVSDNGKGIEERYFKKIFAIFRTLDSDTEIKSRGMGLPVTKKIVELHGGAIWVESEVGKGSMFSFTVKKLVKG